MKSRNLAVSEKILESETLKDVFTIYEKKGKNSITLTEIASIYNKVSPNTEKTVTKKDCQRWKREGVPIELKYEFPEVLRHALHNKVGSWLTTEAKSHISELIEQEHQERCVQTNANDFPKI